MINTIALLSKEIDVTTDKVIFVIESLNKRIAELEEESRTKHEWGMTILGKRLELEQQVADLKESLRYAIEEANGWCDYACGKEIKTDEMDLARERAK